MAKYNGMIRARMVMLVSQPIAGSKQYNRQFFDETHITSSRSARAVVPIIIELIDPTSVVDVGCGTGSWLSTFVAHGVSDIYGIDYASLDSSQLEIPKARVLRHDLTEPFTLDRTFDLCMCLEVAEHLPPHCASQIVDNLTRLSPMVLFSAAIPHQGGTNHINEQWPEYWADLFHKKGYVAVDCIRDAIWQHEDVAYWYAQNLLLYVREDILALYQTLREFAANTDRRRLTLVHPKTYVKNYYLLRSPAVLLMRLGWNLLPRSIRMSLVKPLAELIWKQVSTKY